MKPETKFRQNQVLPFLKTLRNSWFEPIQQVAINGTMDYILCANGLFVALELKKNRDEEPRPLQRHKLDEVVRTGGISIVACPENWDYIKIILKEIDQGRITKGGRHYGYT